MRFKSIVVGIFFGLLIVVGISVSRDYGIPWGESIQRRLGTDVYNYVFGNDEKLLKNKDRYYGPVLEFSLVFFEKTFNLTDAKVIYQVRHMVNYLFFVVGVFFFYLLLLKRFRSIWWALLGSLLLVLSPRIFAHSFYNTRDIGFMSMFIIATYAAVVFSENKNNLFALLAALTSALLVDIRIMGILLPLLLVDVFYLNGYRRKDRKALFLYFLFIVLFIVAFWPTLWKNPVSNFTNAFDQMKNYPQKTSALYFGQRIKSTAVPWHYTLGWIAVTTPISYLILFILGILYFIDVVPKVAREDLLMLGWLSIPLLVTIILKFALYDAWRQMFFVYPPILYFAVYALVKASPKMKKILMILLVVNLTFVISFMIKEHPYQNLYLNEFVGVPYEKKFELDYWGLAYKEGIEYIAKMDKRPLIKIAVENLPGETSLLLLDYKDRQRFELVSNASNANYYLSNYWKYKDKYYNETYYTVNVMRTRILGVYKLK